MKLKIDSSTYSVEDAIEITAENFPGINASGVAKEYFLTGARGGHAMMRTYKNGFAEILKNVGSMNPRWSKVSTWTEC